MAGLSVAGEPWSAELGCCRIRAKRRGGFLLLNVDGSYLHVRPLEVQRDYKSGGN